MARTMQDQSAFVFINMANITLLRCDSYMDFLKQGVNYDTVAALKNSPLYMTSLLPDNIISKAEEEIGHHDDKCNSDSSHKICNRFHPYYQLVKLALEAGKKIQTTSLETTPLSWSVQTRSRQGLQLLTATSQGALLKTAANTTLDLTS